MDYGRSFSYVFSDKKWFGKVFIGGLWNFLALLIFGVFFVLGYQTQVIRNVLEDDAEPLPPWQNLGEKFGWGLMYVIISIVYAVPVALVGPLTMRSHGGPNIITALLYLGLTFWLPAVLINFSRKHDFNAAFRVQEILTIIQADPATYMLAVVLSMAVYVVSLVLGSLALGIGLPFFMFWAMLVQAHILGQVGRRAFKRKAEELEA